MANKSLGSLTLDLLVKMGGFKQGMDEAARAAEKGGDQIAAALTKGLKVAGAKLEESLRTPLERMRAQIAQLNEFLKAGAINQETYNRAVKQARESYASTSASGKAYNSLLAEGRKLTASLRTPQEQLAASLKRYSGLLKAGAINQETYNRAVARTQAQYRSASQTATGFLANISKVNAALLGVGAGFSAVAVVNGIQRAIGAIKSATIEAAEFGSELTKAQAKTGVAAETFSELAVVAEKSEIGIDSLGTAFRKMQVAISNAGSGSDAVLATFKALGINFEQFRQLEPDKQFEEIADAIHALPDEADRARAATELFGRAGAELLPLFEEGAVGLRRAQKAARDLAQTLSQEQIRALDAVDQAIDELNASWDALKKKSTAAIAPSLKAGIDSVTKALSEQGSILDPLNLLWDAFWRAVENAEGLDFATWADVAREMKNVTPGTPEAQAADVYKKSVRELKEMLDKGVISQKEMNEAVQQAAKDYQAAAGAASSFVPEEGPRRSLANLIQAPGSQGGRSRRRAGPGFLDGEDPKKIKDTVSELERAREAILKEISALEQQTATLGLSAEATIRYRITHGDLADEFAKAGPSFDKFKTQLIELTAGLSQDQAALKIKDLIKDIETQITETRALAVEQEQGTQAALDYRLAYGELGEAFRVTAESTEAYRQKVAELSQEQARLEIGSIIEDLEDQISALQATTIEQQRGAVAAIEYRIAHGDLKEVFERSGESMEEFRARVVGLTGQLAELSREQEAAAAADELLNPHAESVERLNLQLDGLLDKLRAGTIGMEEFDAAAAEAEKQAREALGDSASVFLDEAKRNAQDALGEFLTDPFSKGLDGMVEDFGKAMQRIAAQAVAARIVDKIFAGFDDWAGKIGELFKGGGGGFWSGLKGIFGFSQGGPVQAYAGGGLIRGPGSGTSDSIRTALPEGGFVLREQVVRQPGVPQVLKDLETGPLAQAKPKLVPVRVSAGEWYVQPSVVKKPGVRKFLEQLNGGVKTIDRYREITRSFATGGAVFRMPAFNPTFAAPAFATGGIVMPQATSTAYSGMEDRAAVQWKNQNTTVVQQSITINSPNGQVSRPTVMQVTAAAARGAKSADRRNN